MQTIILVLLLLAIGALIERNQRCEHENKSLKNLNDYLSDTIREANTQDVAPKRIKD